MVEETEGVGGDGRKVVRVRVRSIGEFRPLRYRTPHSRHSNLHLTAVCSASTACSHLHILMRYNLTS